MRRKEATERDTWEFYSRKAQSYLRFCQQPIQAYGEGQEKALVLPYIRPGARVLDLGCGGGRSTRYLADATTGLVCGSDVAWEMIQLARQVNGKANIGYLLNDATTMGLKDASFDVVTCFAVLNYIPDVPKVLSGVWRVLRPESLFIATVINRHEAVRFWRYLYLGPYYLPRLLGLWPHRWYERFYSKAELVALFSKDFEILRYEGIRFLPDAIPTVPFNVWRPFFPLTRALLAAMRPLDEYLCRHERTSSYARFHFIVGQVRK